MPDSIRVSAGLPYPLGASWDGSGVNVAVFTAHATGVQLCLFDPDGKRETARIPLPEFTHEVWHGYFPELRPGQLYGLRVDGPYAPEAGHRFNPHKLLLDPYAKAIQGQIRWHDSLHGYRIGHPKADLSFDRRDSARAMPKCRIIDPAHTWGHDRRPRRAWSETVIYEAHVKGMTARRPDIPEELRGTFTALAAPGVVEHLARLGVTAIELMPIHAFFDDRYLTEKGLSNYWGYSTLGFFAPAPRYVAPGHDLHDLKLMVQRLHGAGIEVILDVVYNHTAEGNQMGPTLSFRGIDNASYYVLADDRRYCYDTTGCGNNLNVRHPRVLQMVMDSLRYWVEECHIDGFRFDLAVTLSRDRDNFDPNSPFLDAVAQDPVLAGVKMISESWDIGPNGYQVGAFPPGWAEWNGRFRDHMRGFLKGDPGGIPALATHLLGSADIFDRRGRRPWASVNFLTAHDGFTLMDLYSYNAQTQRGQWRGQPRRQRRQPLVELRRRGRDRRQGRDRPARPDAAHGDGGADRLAWHADDPDGRRDRPQPAGQQQRLLPGRPAHLDGLDAGQCPRRGFPRFRRRRPRRCATSCRCCAAGATCTAIRSGADRQPDVRWLRSDGGDTTSGDWANSADKDVAVVLARRYRRRGAADRQRLRHRHRFQGARSRRPPWLAAAPRQRRRRDRPGR